MDKAENLLADIRLRVPDMIDDTDVKLFTDSKGAAIVVQQEASGIDRSSKVLSLAMDDIEQQNVDIQQVKRTLFVLSSSPNHPCLMRELIKIGKGIGAIDSITRIIFYDDEVLADRLRLTLIFWIPQPGQPHLLQVH